ncbi:MAG: hypothetical protein J5943_02005 [Oribacterium sp.]|nr:hypothetical protein [Oribacterium sp.]MBO6309316.1 hypothetical protein [Oribacterium sp.]MBP3804435.1 hypothetical protein [Oribacterium sp.]
MSLWILSMLMAILKNVQSVQRTLKKLFDTDDHEEIKTFAQHMMESSQRMSARISMINMYIEDIGNFMIPWNLIRDG